MPKNADKRYNFFPGSETIAVIYRIYYKVMNTLAPNVRHISNPVGYTTLIESNMFTNDNTMGKRLIEWGEIDFPDGWKIDSACETLTLLTLY